MAQSRYYSATAQPTVLTASITPTSTIINVLAVTGFPASVPYILALDYNTPSEEIVLVTAQAGTSLTVTRAYDGTSGTSHNTGAGVRHTWTAMDGNDSRAHEAASTGVHGIAGISSVVGTTDTQTLTNKTLTGPSITGPTITGNVAGNPTFTAGVKAGSTGQTTFDTSGKPNSSTFVSSYVESTVSINYSSTSYGDGSTVVSTTLVAPPSGKVFVTGQSQMYQNTAGSHLYSTITVSGSTSGVIRASADATALHLVNFNTGDNNIVPGTLAFIVTSANPGETLTIKWQHRVSANGAAIDYRNISAIPLMG